MTTSRVEFGLHFPAERSTLCVLPSYYINPEVIDYYICCLCGANTAKNVAYSVRAYGTVYWWGHVLLYMVRYGTIRYQYRYGTVLYGTVSYGMVHLPYGTVPYWKPRNPGTRRSGSYLGSGVRRGAPRNPWTPRSGVNGVRQWSAPSAANKSVVTATAPRA